MSAIRITRINLYKHLTTVNFWTPFILAAAAVFEFTSSLKEMAAFYSVPVNGFSALFIMTSPNSVFIIFMGVFIMFCDLPFKDNQQMFLISRSGKRAWIFSHIFYVIFVSLIYFLFIFLCFCAALLPQIAFDAESWGTIIRTIAATNAAQTFVLRFNVPQNVLSDFTPLDGFTYTFITVLGLSILTGLVVMTLNLILKRNIGVIFSGAVVFMYLVANVIQTDIIYYFSPLHWCSIKIADKNGTTTYPDMPWIIIVMSVWFIIELAALFIYGSKKIRFALDTREDIR